MDIKSTNEEFSIVTFDDYDGEKCSIQRLTIEGTPCIKLGIHTVKPEIMARHTEEGGEGWVPYKVPDNVVMKGRMCLTRIMAVELIEVLQRFVEYGSLYDPDNVVFLIAQQVGGTSKDVRVQYENYRLVKAKSKEEAVDKYNEYNGYIFHKGICIKENIKDTPSDNKLVERLVKNTKVIE